MTDLQIGLAFLGVAAVAAVLVYNRVQERRARRGAERAFASRHEDVLLGEAADPARREPTLGTPHPAPPPVRRPEPVPGALPDERVDYIVRLDIPRGAICAEVLELWAPIERRFARRALLAASDGSAWWRPAPGEPGRCTALRAGLQLLGRDGVVPDTELVEFRSEVESLGARVGASLAAPEMRESLEAARELDRICEQADIQVALHVTGTDAPAPIEDSGAPYQVQATASGVTFSFDLPRTEDPARSYEAMARAAAQLAQSAGGRLVDDNGRTLDERALAAIGAELEAVRTVLEARGIHPGSPLALRLFS